VAAGTAQDALLVFPSFTDSTLTDTTTFNVAAVRGTRVDLFTRAGAAGSASVAAPEPSRTRAGECTTWPAVRLASAPHAAAPTWTVAFIAGHAAPLPLDSIEGAPPADSARLAAEIARLASGLPDDTAPAFRGIPYVVRSARRFSAAPGVEGLVAEIVRKLNEEANPREERILLVAEHDSSLAAGRYAAAYSERVSDDEETIETTDVLAAVSVGPSRTPTIVLSREYGEGGEYALLERAGPGQWRLRWSSAYTGC
jgi:hypothetical protein